MLWAGIGFCGSLTTFSSWMLELVRALERGQTQTSIQMLLANLVGGLLLVGLDVIGDRLTEINVTSPTCFREIMDQTGFDVAAMFIDALERAVAARSAA